MQPQKRNELIQDIRDLLTRREIKGKITIMRKLPNQKRGEIISETPTTCTEEKIIIEIIN